jgi:3-oxoisoapionate decarboxylase
LKIGVAGYPVPPGVAPEDALAWTIDEAARLGLQIIGGSPRALVDPEGVRYDANELRRTREHADARGVEIEPYIRGPFDLVGPDAGTARRAVVESIRAAKVLGGPYMRTGYGRLRIESSRFNRSIPLKEHLAALVANLSEAARIAEDEGIVIALENHCDFTGREIERVIREVDRPAVRAALDTGNSLTVFSEMEDDVAALAPLSVTTHLKDMTVVQHDNPGRIPFLPIGCALGEGLLDVKATVDALVERGPRGRDTPIIIEQGWIPVSEGQDRGEIVRDAHRRSVDYLRAIGVAG